MLTSDFFLARVKSVFCVEKTPFTRAAKIVSLPLVVEFYVKDATHSFLMHEAVANGGPKRKPNSVLVSVTLKNDAIGSEKPNANALRLGDSVPISQ